MCGSIKTEKLELGAVKIHGDFINVGEIVIDEKAHFEVDGNIEGVEYLICQEN